MINKIIQGMCESIRQEFGDNCNIYTEKGQKERDESHFLITILERSVDAKPCGSYQNNNSFMVTYVPKTSHINQSINDVIVRLEEILEYIMVEETRLRGIHMKSSVKDEVLSFKVDYNFQTYQRVGEEESMKKLTYKGVI